MVNYILGAKCVMCKNAFNKIAYGRTFAISKFEREWRFREKKACKGEIKKNCDIAHELDTRQPFSLLALPFNHIVHKHIDCLSKLIFVQKVDFFLSLWPARCSQLPLFSLSFGEYVALFFLLFFVSLACVGCDVGANM